MVVDLQDTEHNCKIMSDTLVKIDAIMSRLDSWVSQVGNGKYFPEQQMPVSNLQLLPLYGIQQVRSEIQAICQVIINQPWFQHNSPTTALEIGLGHYGSTHILWRELFHNIVTIESSHDRINKFAENIQKCFSTWILDDNRSNFIIGKSQDPLSVAKAHDLCSNKIDFLFIDGDHSYQAVLSDWLLYFPLVKQGGIVAFHDSHRMYPDVGVPRLLKELEQGKFGICYEINEILHSTEYGISYIIK